MAFIIKQASDYVAPPDGLHEAVCVDVIDKGKQDSPWGVKHKLRLVWELDKVMKDGKRYTAGKTYTVSMHEKSSLRKDLKAWRGKDFNATELKAFDIEKIIGAPCRLLIVHTEKEGVVYGNVQTVMKAEKKLAASGKYIRVSQRSDEHGGTPSYQGDPEPDYDEPDNTYGGEPIPF